MSRFELGIVDTRNIIKSLQDKYDYDFKNYALTFFKRRVELFIRMHNIKEADVFIKKLESESDFFERFIENICVEATEMFRDPSLWRLLKESFLHQQLKNAQGYKIWFPEVSSGEELFSLAILLKELKFLEKVRFYASSISNKYIERVQKGLFNFKKDEVNTANFNRVFSEKSLSDFYTKNDEEGFWDISLIQNTKFIKQSVIFEEYPKGIKLIIFRNNLIYYNQILQERMLKIIYHSLVPGGFLIIGNNEKIDYWNWEKDFTLIDKSESIYKKRLS